MSDGPFHLTSLWEEGRTDNKGQAVLIRRAIGENQGQSTFLSGVREEGRDSGRALFFPRFALLPIRVNDLIIVFWHRTRSKSFHAPLFSPIPPFSLRRRPDIPISAQNCIFSSLHIDLPRSALLRPKVVFETGGDLKSLSSRPIAPAQPFDVAPRSWKIRFTACGSHN